MLNATQKQGVLGRTNTRNVAIAAVCISVGILMLGGLALAGAVPQVFRLRGLQTPVNVTVREGFLTQYVVQIQNLSREHIAEVHVTAKRGFNEQTARVSSLGPGSTTELGGLEWTWDYQPGDTIIVRASGYLPIVF